MNPLVIYLLKSSVSLAALFAIYWWLLRKDTFFMMNRAYLLSMTAVSLLLPLLPLNYTMGPTSSGLAYILAPVTVTNQAAPADVFKDFGLPSIFLWAWTAGVMVLLLRLGWQVVSIIRLAKKSGQTTVRGQRLVVVSGDQGPFSFFNMIFIGKETLHVPQLSAILNHEKVHIRQWHTADLVLVDLVTALQWFNPVAWLIRKEIRSLHEYLADEGVLQRGFSRYTYQQILLDETMGIRVNYLTNHFNVSLLKKRIAMMTRTKSNKWAIGKVFLSLPVMLFLGFVLTAAPVQQDKPKQEKQAKTPAPVTNVNEPYQEVDKMPAFPGGDEARIRFFIANIKYPEEAMKKNLQGKVFVQFLVKADGTIENAKILRGFDDACDAEALRVVNMMPKWIPGENKGKPVDVVFVIPIKFALEQKKAEEPKK